MNGAVSDRAAIEVHDIGLEAVKNEAGELGFRVSVGGGLGRTPSSAASSMNSCPGSTCSAT